MPARDFTRLENLDFTTCRRAHRKVKVICGLVLWTYAFVPSLQCVAGNISLNILRKPPSDKHLNLVDKGLLKISMMTGVDHVYYTDAQMPCMANSPI